MHATLSFAWSRSNMMHQRMQLNEFFCAVQVRTFKHITFSIGDRDEALDVLQDAMISLAQHYADQSEQWPKLFQRIVQNGIRDWYRRKRSRSFIFWRKPVDDNSDEVEVELDFEDPLESSRPELKACLDQSSEFIANYVKQLPQQQQQAFILRAWWEHSVEDSAFAMGCSTGSVKTHYFRACKKLRELMGEEWL